MAQKKKKNESKKEAELKEQQRLREQEEEEKRSIQKKEEEKKALEERIRLRNEEVDRFVEDMKQYNEIVVRRNNEYFFQRKLFQESLEWNDFLDCDTKLRRANVTHLNTFLTEWFEQRLRFQNLGPFFDEINSFILELSTEFLQGRTIDCQGNGKFNEFSQKFLTIVRKSIRLLTTQCMEHLYVMSDGKSIKLSSRCKDPSFGLFFYKGVRTISLPGLTIDLPQSVETCNEHNDLLIRVIKPPFYPGSQERFNNGDIIIGGTFNLQLIRIVARPQLGHWRVVDKVQDTPECIDMVDEPLRYEIEIPRHIVPSDTMKILSLEGDNESPPAILDNINIDIENKKMSFTSLRTGLTFAISQPRTIDLPYKNWTLTPCFRLNDSEHGDFKTSVRFTLDTARLHIEIGIDGATCSLLKSSIPELDHLLHKPMIPTKLLVLLSYHGVHIVPSDTDFSENTPSCDGRLENIFYNDMALLSTAFELKASQLNLKRSHVEGFFQVKESNSLKGFIDPFPMHLMRIEVDSKSKSSLEAPGSKPLPETVNNVRYSILELEESPDSDLHVESSHCLRVKEGSISSVSPIVCLKPFSSNVAIERVMNYSHLQAETVKQLLTLTRLLPFC